eukprot:3864289-Amphidinium_carterae.1
MLCAEGVRGMSKLFDFDIGFNRHAGSMPPIWPMPSMLVLSGNRFSGTLAERGAAKDLVKCMLNANSFSGALPDAMLSSLGLTFFLVQDNLFQGALPAVASMWSLLFYDVSHNLLTGTVPQGVGAQPELRIFMSAGVQHEGTIPASVSRTLSAASPRAIYFTAFSYGHGLRGSLPRLAGVHSLMTLSVWGNELEGRLHDFTAEFQFLVHHGAKDLESLPSDASVVLLHCNHFSCGLPRLQGHLPKVSMALVGNHFRQPARFPPWICELERGSLFCVSSKTSV